MIDLHIPTENTVQAVSSVVGYVTERLDAVVIEHGFSDVYEGFVHLKLTGNSRDLAIATERASKIGGVVD